MAPPYVQVDRNFSGQTVSFRRAGTLGKMCNFQGWLGERVEAGLAVKKGVPDAARLRCRTDL